MSKNWYQHKMERGFTHRGNPVQKGQKVWLTDKQAEGLKGRIMECEAPETILDCAAPEDHVLWQESLKANAKSDSKKGEIIPEQEDKSTKANRRKDK